MLYFPMMAAMTIQTVNGKLKYHFPAAAMPMAFIAAKSLSQSSASQFWWGDVTSYLINKCSSDF
jgi:hypothetical protein